MCGRFDLTVGLETLAKAYAAERPDGLTVRPHYNIAPLQETPIVVGGEAAHQLVSARFGMRPDWWSIPGRELINVRKESLGEKPYFRKLLTANRCIVPATGFFEWHHAGHHKTPFRFLPRDGDLLSMAGLFLVSDFGFRKSYSFAILTCSANETVAPIHDRMPAMLNQAGIEAWLSANSDSMELETWIVSAPEEYLRLYPVSQLVNNVRNDSPEVIRPANE